MIRLFTFPVVMTFDAEVIIRLSGQLCPTGIRLKNCLSQLDAGRNMIFFLLFDSQMIVPIDILFIRCDLTLP